MIKSLFVIIFFIWIRGTLEFGLNAWLNLGLSGRSDFEKKKYKFGYTCAIVIELNFK